MRGNTCFDELPPFGFTLIVTLSSRWGLKVKICGGGGRSSLPSEELLPPFSSLPAKGPKVKIIFTISFFELTKILFPVD